MPKQTLRGKRHIRARKIITIKRIEKRIKKLIRAKNFIERFFSNTVRDVIDIMVGYLEDYKKAAQ